MELTRPFAENGDRQDFPVDTQGDGTMSLQQGFGAFYGLPPEEGGLFIDRTKFNQLMYLVSKGVIDNKTSIADALEQIQSLESKYSSLVTSSPKLLTENLTWNVGIGGDYEDLESAINEATKYVSNNHTITLKVINDLTVANSINISSQVGIIIKSDSKSTKLNINIDNGNFINYSSNYASNAILNFSNITLNSIKCNSLIYSSFYSPVQIRDCIVQGSFNNLGLASFGGSIYVINSNITSTNSSTDDAIFKANFNSNIILHSGNTINGGNVIADSSYGSIITSGYTGLTATGNFNKGLIVSKYGIIINSGINLTSASFSGQKYSQTPTVLTSDGFIQSNV